MSSAHRSHLGFTLIELMIAIALGMLLIYAATAGIRVAAQTVTSANRLALENSMLRIGFEQALDELDFWTAYDDPHSKNAGEQALRRSQFPFSQMPSKVSIQASVGGKAATAQYTYPSPESDTGWDAFYIWPPNDPRTWWRANPAENYDTAGRNGSYAVFANNNGSPHPWLFKQIEMLHTNLGYYGFCDYLPPSMLYSYIDKGIMSVTFTKAGTSFRNGDGATDFSQGRYRCTKDTSYVITPLKPIGGAKRVTTAYNRKIWGTGASASESSVTDLMNTALSSQPQLEVKPEHWPEVNVEVSRFLCHNRFVTLSRVQWTDAYTGQIVNLNFTALGTTLRGARQQRKPGPPGSGAGWAKWYGPNEAYGEDPDQNNYHLDYMAQ
jgi:prepilin-type N-terminal cleavage/methylation domain-containing protein